MALQTHLPMPDGFGDRIVLQLLPEGYSGQAPVGDGLLNLCLVSRPGDLSAVKRWAEGEFLNPDRSSMADDRTAGPRGAAREPARAVFGGGRGACC